MTNPYYELWLEAQTDETHRLSRNELCVKYSWAVPDDNAIKFLANLGPIIEVGSGTGYWASLITKAGGDIIATDLKPPGTKVSEGRNPEHSQSRAHFKVALLDQATAASRHPDRTLMLCWPRAGHTAVEAYHAAGGQRIVFIGEVHGCTGSDELMGMLDYGFGWRCPAHDWGEDAECTCSDGRALFRETQCIEIPQWAGMHDYLYVHERIG